MQSLTLEEHKKLLAVITNKRHKLFVVLGYNHAMRRGELLRLHKSDFVEGHIRIYRLKKRGKPNIQVQPLLAEETSLVDEVIRVTAGDALFPWGPSAASNLIRLYLTAAGVYTFPYKKSLHSLRHSAGRDIYSAYHDVLTVAEYLSHDDLDSSRIYAKPDPNEVNIRVAKALRSGLLVAS